MEMPSITTSRLILRPFTQADVAAMHQILSATGVLRYFPNSQPPSPERVRHMIANLLNHWDQYGYGLWAIESRLTGKLMGRSGLQYLLETDEVEVDFILGREFWGQGFATEAGQAALRHGFETLDISTIVGIVHVGNKASQRVLEKLGMRRMAKAGYFGMDCYRYGIERASFVDRDWP